MALILRFANESSIIKECFIDIADVNDTSTLTLKNERCVLSHHSLDVQNIYG